MAFVVRCRRCNKHFFCTSLGEGLREFTEHWMDKHWRFDAAPDTYPFVYQGKSPIKRKAIWGKKKIEKLPADSEYEIAQLTDSEWEAIEPLINTPGFNKFLYHS